jgi:hypothetical protein
MIPQGGAKHRRWAFLRSRQSLTYKKETNTHGLFYLSSRIYRFAFVACWNKSGDPRRSREANPERENCVRQPGMVVARARILRN